MHSFWQIEGKDPSNRPLRWWFMEGAFNGKYKVIAEFDGTAGTIFTFDAGQYANPRYLIAKVPKISSEIGHDVVREKVRRFLFEINETYRYGHHPLISSHVNVGICCGLPVVLSRKAEFTLLDLIEVRPLAPIEAAQIAAQIAHVLVYCASRGLTAHQDLKPENVLVERLADGLLVPDGIRYPLDHRVLICDFGMANAFGAFGTPYGSRPYMAPEQYAGSNSLVKSDVFALGVVLHELLTGGLHPIGEPTRDVWPKPVEGKPKKWVHEDVWKKWARSQKNLDKNPVISLELADVVRSCLDADIAVRMSAKVLESMLLEFIKVNSQSTYDNLALLLSYFDSIAASNETSGWPYYERLLEQVNAYDYS
jgi:serine/threonine protein kinase